MTSIQKIVIAACALMCFSCRNEGIKNSLDAERAVMAEVRNYTSERLTMPEFVSWCSNEENRLNKVKDISDMRYNLSYLPPQTMAFLELRTRKYSMEEFKQVSENYTEMSYFNFKLEVIGGSGELLKHRLRSAAQYEARIKYMSFDMDKDICLVQNGDTLLPGLFHFERIFEVAPYANVMLAFDNTKFRKDEEFTIVYNDRLFEKGFVKFTYNNKQLINLPTISAL